MPKKKTGMLWRLLILWASEILRRTGTRTNNRVLRQEISYRKNINSIFSLFKPCRRLFSQYRMCGCSQNWEKLWTNQSLRISHKSVQGRKKYFSKRIWTLGRRRKWNPRNRHKKMLAPRRRKPRCTKDFSRQNCKIFIEQAKKYISILSFWRIIFLSMSFDSGNRSRYVIKTESCKKKQSLAKTRVLRKPESCEIDILN